MYELPTRPVGITARCKGFPTTFAVPVGRLLIGESRRTKQKSLMFSYLRPGSLANGEANEVGDILNRGGTKALGGHVGDDGPEQIVQIAVLALPATSPTPAPLDHSAKMSVYSSVYYPPQPLAKRHCTAPQRASGLAAIGPWCHHDPRR
jgi:hypothetical protein